MAADWYLGSILGVLAAYLLSDRRAVRLTLICPLFHHITWTYLGEILTVFKEAQRG